MPKRVAGAWNAKFHPGLQSGLSYLRTNVRMIFLELKFLGCIDNQILLLKELRFAHARTPLWINYKTRTENAPVSSFSVRSDRFPSLFIYFKYSEILTLQKVPLSGGVSPYWSLLRVPRGWNLFHQHSNVTGLSLQISGTGKTPLGCGLFGLPIKRRFKFCLHCVIDYKERWRETYIKNDISTPDQLFIII